MRFIGDLKHDWMRSVLLFLCFIRNIYAKKQG